MTSEKEKREAIKKAISRAYGEYVRAYRRDEGMDGVELLPPRDEYPDIVSYQTDKVMEALENLEKEQ